MIANAAAPMSMTGSLDFFVLWPGDNLVNARLIRFELFPRCVDLGLCGFLLRVSVPFWAADSRACATVRLPWAAVS